MAKRKSRAGQKAPRNPRWVGAFRVATWVVVALLLCGAAAFGVRTAWQAVGARPAFRVEPGALRVTAFPEWVKGPEMTGELQRVLDRVPPGRSLLDPDIARIVGDELASCPWLLEVNEVRRELPNSLRVKAAFRKPAGLVSYEGRTYMVDVEGWWLPDRLFNTPEAKLPVIEDALLREPPAVGRAWDGPRLAVGARLTQFMQRFGLLSKIAVTSIDVSGVARAAIEPDITLGVPWVRDDGSPGHAQIRWGKSTFYAGLPGLEDPILEVPDREKAQRVLANEAEHPALRGIKYLDPRFHNQIVFAEAD
jgi:hypothetical protein